MDCDAESFHQDDDIKKQTVLRQLGDIGIQDLAFRKKLP